MHHGKVKRRTRVISLKPLPESPGHKATELAACATRAQEVANAARQRSQPISIINRLPPSAANRAVSPDLEPHSVDVPLRESKDDKDERALGSWARRQTTHAVYKPTAASPLQSKTPATHTTIQIPSTVTDMSEAGTAEKAWRQTFMYKCRKQQARPCRICHYDMCDDPWHAALHMLQAAHVHPDLHMPVPDHDCYHGRSPSPLLGADDEVDEAFDNEQSAAECGQSISTAHMIQTALSEAANRPRQLLKHQVHSCAIPACAHTQTLQSAFPCATHYAAAAADAAYCTGWIDLVVTYAVDTANKHFLVHDLQISRAAMPHMLDSARLQTRHT